jgi:voltage-gated potassium channel
MNGITLLSSLIGEIFSNPKAAKERVVRGLVRDIVEGRWRPFLTVAAIHLLISYLGFVLVGEEHLVPSWITFAYYYVTTGSTIGYGDLSPVSAGGQLFFMAWVAPGALLIFGYVLTRLAAGFTLFLRNHMSGQGSFEHTRNHLIIVGYVAGQTEQLISETNSLHHGKDIVLVTVQENLPLPDRIHRVRTTSLASSDDLIRAGVKGACSVVIMAGTDEDTMSACLALSALKPSAHVVAYFRDSRRADLVRPHCPKFEFVASTSVHQVSRAIVDPGASQVFAHLASTAVGATLGSIDYDGPDTTVRDLRDRLEAVGATLIGYRHDDDHAPTLHLTSNTRIGAEHTLFYIAAERVPAEALAA